MALIHVVTGELGSVWKYRRPNGKCPATEFLEKECRQHFPKKFDRSFGAAVLMGSDYVNDDRFYPLHGVGKPLWEFKEHDHRLYCHRIVDGKSIKVILFNGWVKDKRGKTEENQEIDKAQKLYQEYLNEQ